MVACSEMVVVAGQSGGRRKTGVVDEGGKGVVFRRVCERR